MCFGRRKSIKNRLNRNQKQRYSLKNRLKRYRKRLNLIKKRKYQSKKNPTGKKSEKALDSQKEFLNVFKQFSSRHRSWDIWRDFITMFACSLSNPTDKEHYDEREALYLRTIKKYNKKEQELFPELAAHTVMALEKNPEQDFLGSIFMSLNLGNEHNGQFFTPYHV